MARSNFNFSKSIFVDVFKANYTQLVLHRMSIQIVLLTFPKVHTIKEDSLYSVYMKTALSCLSCDLSKQVSASSVQSAGYNTSSMMSVEQCSSGI